jgi:hypothetical protein
MVIVDQELRVLIVLCERASDSVTAVSDPK